MRFFSALFLALTAGTALAQPASGPPSTPLRGLVYDAPLFPGATYDPGVPTPDSVLGYRLGDKAASPAEIEAVIKAIAAASPRVKLFEYATTHEGRPLHYLVVTKPERAAHLDDAMATNEKLSDPRKTTGAEADSLIDSAPLVAWMAYVIHGDEMSGSDAALAVLYHLAASKDAEVTKMLDELVVVIDPLMNPDGRDRCVTMIRQHKMSQPEVDDQTIVHTQVWPSGRMNHYLFDMNRDWIFATQPETRGRIAAVARWNPQYFMESHEMGGQDTFLFMPARDPVNNNYPGHSRRWGETISHEHAAAFDAMGWRYYSGEWNESWYPGYSSSWGALRGAIEQLYEQAGIQTDAVRRPEGTLQSYREAVHHQLVSSWANLQSCVKHRKEILRDYVDEKRNNLADEGRFGKRVFAVLPGANRGRGEKVLDLALLQGFEVFEAGADFSASGVDRFGREIKGRTFPAGTLLIPAQQPLGNLVTAMFEFDPRFSDAFLTEERRELLRFDRSRLYDTTAWNITMLFDVESCELSMSVPAGARRVDSIARNAPTIAPSVSQPTGYVIDGEDDRSVSLAARLMARGVWVRYAEKRFTFDGVAHARGSLVVVAKDNTGFAGDLRGVVQSECDGSGLQARAVSSGLGDGDLPDLGGGYFQLLQPPRIAVLSQSPTEPYSFGEVWHMIDQRLRVRSSALDALQLGAMDLRRYNVLIIPDGPGTGDLQPHVDALKAWVLNGGTLIAMGSSASALARESGIGATREYSDVLGKTDDYRMAVIREWEGATQTPVPQDVWARTPRAKAEFPWSLGEEEKASEEELKRRDAWAKVFTPVGAVVAARTDDRHWLAAGCAAQMPVLYGGSTVLMAPMGVQAPVRLGVFEDAPVITPPPPPAAERTDAEKKEEKPEMPGWTLAPKGKQLTLRMSGLLWPEAAERIANSAYVTREQVGRGQVILFASNPAKRGATLGTERILSNAIVYGPGLGANQPIVP